MKVKVRLILVSLFACIGAVPNGHAASCKLPIDIRNDNSTDVKITAIQFETAAGSGTFLDATPAPELPHTIAAGVTWHPAPFGIGRACKATSVIRVYYEIGGLALYEGDSVTYTSRLITLQH